LTRKEPAAEQMHLPALGHCAPAPLGNRAQPEKILKAPRTVGLGIDKR